MKEKKWWYEDSMFEGEKIRCAKLAQADVMQGGWYHGRKWLTNKAIDKAEERWANRSYEAGRQEPDYDKKGEYDWIPHQCGGCKFMAALGGDFGICWNQNSPMDGCIIFEHGGCVKHSELVEVLEKGEK
jgi:hypothetical protein